MPNPYTGTGFTNLSNLLQANQNNRLGSTIEQGVQGNINKLNQGVNQVQGQFNQDLNSANLNTQPNQQFVSNTISNIANPPANINAPQGQIAPTSGNVNTQSTPQVAGTQPTAPGMVTKLDTSPTVQSQPTQLQGTTAPAPNKATSGAASTDLAALPGSFGYASNATSGSNQTVNQAAPTAGDISRFGQYLSGSYSGPTGLQNIGALQGQAQNIQDLGRNVNTPGGLQTLLQKYIGGPGYNRGEQALDTLLLGQTGYPQLQNIAKNTQNIANVPQAAQSKAQSQAAQTALGNQQFGQDIRKQLASAEAPLLQNIKGNIQSQEQKNQAIQDAATQINQYLNSPLAKQFGAGTPNTITVPGQYNPTDQQDYPYELANPNKPRVGGLPGNTFSPSTDQGAASAALKQAVDAGLITPDQMGQMLTSANANPNIDLKKFLQGSFNPYQAANPYTMQQGANAQQAAQLNALSQLAGQGQQFSTYGGLNPATAGFDMNKFMEQVKGAQPYIADNDNGWILPDGTRLQPGGWDTSGSVPGVSQVSDAYKQYLTKTTGA